MTAGPGSAQAGPPVVVGVDGSDCSGVALQVAHAEAQSRRAPLVVVHAWLVTAPGVDVTEPVRLDAETEQRLARTVHEHVEDLLQGAPRVEVEERVVYGYAGRVLSAASEGAGLVVVGTRGLGALHGMLLGSVSQYVLEHACCPVLVAHAAPHGGPRRVVVGMDGSPSSRDALRWADAEAVREQVPLLVVHAARAARGVLEAELPGSDDDPRARLSTWVRDELGEERASSVELEVETGPAARVLRDVVTPDDLLVVGRSGTTGILRLGSVARRLATHVPGGLVVVPPA